MRAVIFILFIISLIMAPIFAYADCSKVGVTVIFVNGVFEDEASAKSDKDLLRQDFKNIAGRDDVSFINGYNESHVGGVDDLVSVIIQAYAGGYLDHDLTDILRQAHTELQTQKIILVGHSQGTFYTNAAYDYLVSHGVDKSAISVYNVATPADKVAGSGENPGKYLTSSTDEVINSVVRDLTSVAGAKKPLPANIDIKIPNEKGVDYEEGHSFSTVYLGLVPDRIIGDIDQQLSGLTADNNKDECFKQPDLTTMYLVEDGGYKLVDSMGKYSKDAATAPDMGQMASIANAVFGTAYNFGKGIVSDITQAFQQKNDLGASLVSAPVNKNLPNISTSVSIPASAPDIAQAQPVENQITAAPVETESTQDQLDDIQEKLDIISQQVQVLVAQQTQNSQIALAVAEETPANESGQSQNSDQDNNADNQNANSVSTGSGGGGGGSPVVYPKILISEIQIDPIGQRFVELYNPNIASVDLTGWYLQRKDANDTSWLSLIHI